MVYTSKEREGQYGFTLPMASRGLSKPIPFRLVLSSSLPLKWSSVTCHALQSSLKSIQDGKKFP